MCHHAEQQDKHKRVLQTFGGWFKLCGSLLVHVHTVLHFMNINSMFTQETSLSLRVISSHSVWAQLIISQTDI